MAKKVYKSLNGQVYNNLNDARRANYDYKLAQKLSSQIDKSYIGGGKYEVRDKFWKADPVLKHATDSIAYRYGINPNMLRNRLNNEGFVDEVIKQRNYNTKELLKDNSYYGYNLLHKPGFGDLDGYHGFGLDDGTIYINSGKVKPINETWFEGDTYNEHGRHIFPSHGSTIADNIGLTAAHLKYFGNEVRKDYPNISDKFADKYSVIYYNAGRDGAKRMIKNNNINVPEYSFRNGGKISLKNYVK